MAPVRPGLTSAPVAPATTSTCTLASTNAAQKTARLMKNALSSAIVHVKVGKELQDFGVHRDIICHYSPYFKAAFTSGFEESKTGIMKVPELQVYVFGLFNTWLYTQSLWTANDEKESWPCSSHLIELYIYADMVRVPALMNHIIDTLVAISDLVELLPTHLALSFGWVGTSASSPLRRLIVDWIALEAGDEFLDEHACDLPVECLAECFKVMRPIVRSHLKTVPGKKLYPGFDASRYYVAEDTQ